MITHGYTMCTEIHFRFRFRILYYLTSGEITLEGRPTITHVWVCFRMWCQKVPSCRQMLDTEMDVCFRMWWQKVPWCQQTVLLPWHWNGCVFQDVMAKGTFMSTNAWHWNGCVFQDVIAEGTLMSTDSSVTLTLKWMCVSGCDGRRYLHVDRCLILKWMCFRMW